MCGKSLVTYDYNLFTFPLPKYDRPQGIVLIAFPVEKEAMNMKPEKIFTFTDLPIAKMVYRPNSFFGRFFEIIGTLVHALSITLIPMIIATVIWIVLSILFTKKIVDNGNRDNLRKAAQGENKI